MKKTVLLSLLALPFTAHSQQVSLGLQAGINPKTTGKYVPAGPSNFNVGIRTMLGFKHFEAGVGFETGGYNGKAILIDGEEREFYKSLGDYTVNTSATYYALYAIGNYKLALTDKLGIYAGIAIGWDIGEAVGRTLSVVYESPFIAYFPQRGVNIRDHALGLGIQTGVRYHLSKIFSIQGELAARSAKFLEHDRYMSFYFPVTIGITAQTVK